MHPQEASGAAEKATAPYGSWESPITAAAVSAAGRTVEGIAVAGDGRLVWVEKRPDEGGASVLVREPAPAEPRREALDVTPPGFAVRTLAQEYGGGSGAFAVQGDTVVFSNYSDQRLYRQTIGDSSPLPLTPDYAGSEVRYADGVFDPHFHRYVTTMEDHRGSSSDPIATIAAVKISDRDVNEPTILVETGRVDGQRLCVTGESAGGFTTLACLSFRQTFKAGCSLYGIADLTSLRASSHKFEACYSDNLVGNKQAYFERAPINFVDKFTCPLILFHGLEDTVVPPDQTTKIYKAIKDKGLPVALVEYEGEPHGFRKAENIKFTLEQEMMFFARLVGKFKVADDMTPIKIENFD